MENIIYGSLAKRVKATLLDFLVIMALGLLVSTIFSRVEDLPNYARIIAFCFIFFLYDPIFVSLFGCTIGQFLLSLKVRRNNNETLKIIFPIAVIRFIIKVLLGWMSLLTITGNNKRMAIHDMVANSVVIDK